jgi:hypothetical protein
MPRLGFEPTTPVFERSKAVLAVDRAASVIGSRCYGNSKFITYAVFLCMIRRLYDAHRNATFH